VDDGSGPCPEWAIDYEKVSSPKIERFVAPWGRSGDDLILMYTGGTTGMPKGVMWRQDDLLAKLNSGSMIRFPEDGGLRGVKKTIVGAGPRHMPACPLMHGTGAFTSYAMLSSGGSVVTLPGRKFDAEELLDTVDYQGVNTIAIVGDAFAKPILAALDAHPKRWRLSSIIAIVSSGVMWSEETKQGLLRHKPTAMLIDTFSSSEAIGMGVSMSTGTSTTHTASFELGPEVRVIDPETGTDVEPGSGEAGLLALGGRNPIGYYKDEAKSDSTFRTFQGVRYSVPGDFAEVRQDGTIHLLGRGSVVINTGGEKVFAEEVEESVKQHPSVADAVAVGVPDDRFGEVIAVAVELRPGKAATADEIQQQVRSTLAGFKTPRLVRIVDSIGRAPTGKVDYGKLRADTVAWSEESKK
jgi:acyl-CoA synthetase (AMP-forming)/AMP-acid ligase II